MSRIAKRRLGDWAVVALCLLISLALGWTVTLVQQQGDRNDRQSEQIDALAAALAAEQEAAEDRGETPVAPDPSELLDDPQFEPEPGPSGPAGPGPSDSQVYAAVSAYFTAHPVEDGEDGADASPTAIAAAVANYLTANPPAQGDPGPPPSAQQIADAVEAYLTEHPPPAGPPGADGDDATPEEIAAQVAAYLDTHPLEYCPDGYSLVAHTVLTTEGPTDQIDCVAEPEEN
jgi:type II secretory pathway pseudopilin PulG